MSVAILPIVDSERSARGTVIGTLTFVAVAVAAVFFLVVAAPQAVGAEASYVVLSDSMQPTLEAGDVVVVRSVEPEDVSPGDIITYRHPESTADKERITHRVVAVDDNGDAITYQTRGDANDNLDPWTVSENELIGSLWFTIPFVGNLVVFMGTRLGILLLIVLPGSLLVMSELWSLYHELES